MTSLKLKMDSSLLNTSRPHFPLCPLFLALSTCSFPQIHFPSVSSWEKSRPPRDDCQTGQKRYKTRRKPPYWGWIWHQIGCKESQEQAKQSEVQPLSLLGIPQNHQANSHKIHRGPGTDPWRPHECPFHLCKPMWALLNWFGGSCLSPLTHTVFSPHSDCIHPLPCSSQIHPPSTLTQFWVFSLLQPSVPACAVHSWMCGPLLGCGWLTRGYTLTENELSLSQPLSTQ